MGNHRSKLSQTAILRFLEHIFCKCFANFRLKNQEMSHLQLIK